MSALTRKVIIFLACLSFPLFVQSQCTSITELVFENPTLISGSNQAYRFPNVNDQADAIVSIYTSYNASLVHIDKDNKGEGNAFQPRISLDNQNSSGTEGYIDFKIDFVYANTETPIDMDPYVVSAVDIDGDNYRLRESVGFGDFSNFTLDGVNSAIAYYGIPGTNMMSFETTSYDGLSGIATHESSNSVLFDFNGGSSIIIRARIIDDGENLPSKGNKRLFSFNFDPCLINCYTNPITFPVEYNYFQAQTFGEHVELNWETSLELNNDRFEIERSTDGENFQLIGTVTGVGNSDVAQIYRFVDTRPVYGKLLYRLKQIDFDGAFTYSSVEEIIYQPALDEISMNVYPNPTTDFINVSSNGDLSGALIHIYDTKGQRIRTEQMSMGVNIIDLRTLVSGVYYVEMQTGYKILSGKKIIKN